MARVVKVIFILLVLGAGACVFLHMRFESFLATPLELGAPERVIYVPEGSNAAQVVDILKQSGVIQNDWMMLYELRRSGLSSRLQPGNVVLVQGMTPRDLPELFSRTGRYERIRVQILPGMNLYEIARRLHDRRLVDERSFLSIALDGARAAESGVPASAFEGYLAAGAYTFDVGTSPDAVLDAMHARWREYYARLISENRGAYESLLRRGMNDHMIVTLASMVEKEAVVEDEKPVIAKIFFNRLRRGMKLQSDPTCVYPPQYPGENPSPARCREADNRYSTYVIPALPPGPITTVSTSSIRAVFMPYDGPDAGALYYFVARRDGSHRHYFSKTYREHEKAVRYFLKGDKKSLPSGTVQPKKVANPS